jgi:hypothetical protein
MDQSGEDEEATRDSNNDELNDGERTPQQMETESAVQQQMEVETPTTAQEETTETSQPTEENAEDASTSERPAEQAENAEDQPGPSGIQQPEEEDGLDPAFLAALPDDIRQEVIRDHQRQQRLNQLERRRREQSNTVAEGANNETNPAAGEANAQGEGNQPAEEDDSIDPEFLGKSIY